MTYPLTVIDNIELRNTDHGKPILMDVRSLINTTRKPVIVFIHGFKGFKDWGHWNLIADQFAKAGYCVVKFNLSHNGTTPDHPVDFVDLDAFSKNTYSIELNDVGSVLDYLHSPDCNISNIDLNKIYLVGHSRGGGLALLKAKEDARVAGVVTWASVSDFGSRWSDEVMEKWAKDKVHYVYNGRTKQDMPMKYTIVEDYNNNIERLNIKNAVGQLKIPLLHIHGTDDPTVGIEEARTLAKWNSQSELEVIDNADHVFNGRHPFHEEELPLNSQQLVDKTLSFLDKISK